jgi:hypothetical protein
MRAPGFPRSGGAGKGAVGLLLVVLLGGAVFALGAWYPESSRFLPRCLLHETTGLHCSGCGGQRAMQALLQGNLLAALGHNALLVLALPFVLYTGVRGAGEGRFGWNLPRLRVRAVWIWGVLALILLFTLARNLPWEPFRHLAP